MPRNKKSPVRLLGSCPLFEGLSSRELGQIMKVSKEVEFPVGSEIVKEGTRGVGFHLILEGKAKVIVGGRTRVRYGPGDFFGEMSLIDGGPRSATVVAETPVTTLAVTSWEFMPLIERYPSIAKKLLMELTRRLRETDRSLSH